ncbi:MAG: DUF192 domain-containing protein [Candidatus Aenigmatarchaeota archaeon]
MKKLVIISLILLILISGCIERREGEKIYILTKMGKVKVMVETAKTPKEHERGLMFRENLEENSGMLFIFPREERKSFWMKNTLIPLDMIFIYSNGTINEIKQNVQPCKEDPCPTYPSKHPSKYVLEVNGGFCERKGIKVGDFVDFSNLNDLE